MANAASDYTEDAVLDHSLGTSAWTMPDVYIGFTTPTANAVTFTNATNRVNWTSHTLSNGDPVFFNPGTAGVLPTGITAQTRYYVINTTANDFQVSLTSGGSAVTFSDDGTAPNNVYKGLKEDGTNLAALEQAVADGYAREDITFSAASGGSASNSSTHTFTATGDWDDVIEWIIADSSSGVNMLYHFPLTTMRIIKSGESLTIAATAIVVTAD